MVKGPLDFGLPTTLLASLLACLLTQWASLPSTAPPILLRSLLHHPPQQSGTPSRFISKQLPL
ncbi:hypothetical protein M758_7G130100 [Ceratodon purpureus]|nr:hypothetical protein M758_7G130100 [Ceratodon purpureus]